MSFTTEQQVVDALPGQELLFYKPATSQGSNFQGASSWTTAGEPPAGSAPTTVVQCTRSTTGAIRGWVDPTGGAKTYLAAFGVFSVTPSAPPTLYDRLIHSGGLVGNLATTQTTNLGSPPAIPRGDTNGVDVECFLEIYTGLGATPATATISYTNQDGTAGRSGTASIPASVTTHSMLPVTLAAGDYGVRSVQSVTLSISTGTAGNFGITLLRRIWHAGVIASSLPIEDDWIMGALPVVEDNACLAIMAPQSAGAMNVNAGFIRLIQG